MFLACLAVCSCGIFLVNHIEFAFTHAHHGSNDDDDDDNDDDGYDSASAKV